MKNIRVLEFGKVKNKIKTHLNIDSNRFIKNKEKFLELIKEYDAEEKNIKMGGGSIRIQKQHDKGRMTARERIKYLVGDNFFELGLYAAYEMYKEVGEINSAGVVTGVGKVENRHCMIIANDATVKAGAYFEITLKKTLRAQRIALENNLPILYLVDSAGVFLPLQDKVFPDEEHFGRIFYNNARMSALGLTQIACVMGPCVAGGAYLPVMCDKYIIVEGASMFLAGPALVKAAIGQKIDQDTLGGANTHTSISGTADYYAENDLDALDRIKTILSHINFDDKKAFNKKEFKNPDYSPDELLGIFNPEASGQYDMLEIISRIVDERSFDEYKQPYGKTLICGTGSIGGYSLGIVANQKTVQKSTEGQMQMGGVIYSDSADKAARFIMNCNQDKIPILFIHDVNGFMVGKDAEWGGIAKDGAKLVNAVSNSTVPKITLVVGGSYGAGNYALSGRAYQPRFMFTWPSSKLAVMGGEQAAKTMTDIKISKMGKLEDSQIEEIFNNLKANYDKQSDPRYAAARLWTDMIINPVDTRQKIIEALDIINNQDKIPAPKFGVLQV